MRWVSKWREGNIILISTKQITVDAEKKSIARKILEALSEWFEMEEGRETYIQESEEKCFVCAYDEDKPIGFLYLKETGKDTVELAVMGILKEYHRKGIGRKLFAYAKHIAYQEGYSFIQVKTVKMGMYEDYDKTNLFYLSLGFKEFEVFSFLWDERNPCQVYVMALK